MGNILSSEGIIIQPSEHTCEDITALFQEAANIAKQLKVKNEANRRYGIVIADQFNRPCSIFPLIPSSFQRLFMTYGAPLSGQVINERIEGLRKNSPRHQSWIMYISNACYRSDVPERSRNSLGRRDPLIALVPWEEAFELDIHTVRIIVKGKIHEYQVADIILSKNM